MPARNDASLGAGANLSKKPQRDSSINNINRSLCLQTDTYLAFYAAIELIMTEKGWIGKGFCSTLEKERVCQELCSIVRKNEALLQRFPTAIQSMASATWQSAFHRLVYKISSNYRRRKKRTTITRQELSSHSPSFTPARNPSYTPTAQMPNVCSPRPPGSSHYPNGWPGMMSIVPEKGSIKPLCRPCELARGWPNLSANHPLTVDDLDFDAFLSILESDHNFDRTVCRLGWENGSGHAPSHQPTTIDNDRQWRAVIAHMMQLGQALNFVILPSQGERSLSESADPQGTRSPP